MTDIKDFFWICPKCGEKVNAIEQIALNLFDEDDGESMFEVADDGFAAVPLHTILCPKCDSYWLMSIGKMIRSE